ncbi:hypothetical protein AGMMS49928_08160 [Spirochaetia bacterium]|nr:hypothetical protein AGMMS49928_08160 [Spirochaetia bacterium]
MKRFFLLPQAMVPQALVLVLLFSISAMLRAETIYSPTWGFYLDLPADYQLSSGDGNNRFSFTAASSGMHFDLIAYPAGTFASVEALADDVGRRLGNRGDKSVFDYRGKKASLLELNFPVPGPSGSGPSGSGSSRGASFSGWGLCVEMAEKTENGKRPLLLALAYGPPEKNQLLHISALDSIAPSAAERRLPGPLSEFTYPRGKTVKTKLANAAGEALITPEDAEAAQALVDREYETLRLYADTPLWQEAWSRFYRIIYRDSFERVADIAFTLERRYNAGSARDFAEKVLQFVQAFQYERNPEGSDFVNLVTAATEGRGDCDSRSLLWAIILEQADIPAAIMVSQEYSHAMGLADLEGPGARFEADKKKWLVAETTAKVALGLIGETKSEISKWMAVLF